MNLGEHTLYILIVACEVAFWVALFAGLTCRYVLRWQRASKFLLVCVPLIDVALLAFTVMDLRAGASATFAHGLAAAYVGFTVAFGPIMIDWADRHFAHWFGGGPAPEPAPSHGWAGVLYELKLWGRCLVAVGITYLLLIAMIEFVGQPSRTAALYLWFRITFGTVVVWFVFGPLWNLIFFRRALKQ